MHEYPTDEDLDYIKSAGNDFQEHLNLIDFIEKIWWPGDGLRKRTKRSLWLATAGWSGNEDIIRALNGTFFWMKFWESSHRGGLYKFNLRGITLT